MVYTTKAYEDSEIEAIMNKIIDRGGRVKIFTILQKKFLIIK
jgi:hypothetical protein